MDIEFAKLPTRTTEGLVAGMGKLDAEMRAFAAELGIEYLSPLSVLCNDTGCITRIGDAPQFVTAWDNSHLTVLASEFLIAKFTKIFIVGAYPGD